MMKKVATQRMVRNSIKKMGWVERTLYEFGGEGENKL